MSGVRILSRTLYNKEYQGNYPGIFCYRARRMTRTRGFGLRFAPVGAKRRPPDASTLSRTLVFWRPQIRLNSGLRLSMCLKKTGLELFKNVQMLMGRESVFAKFHIDVCYWIFTHSYYVLRHILTLKTQPSIQCKCFRILRIRINPYRFSPVLKCFFYSV